MQFSTNDNDNDLSPASSCANDYHGAWWYNQCRQANLNGEYKPGGYDNDMVIWSEFRGYTYSLKRTEMKVKAKH